MEEQEIIAQNTSMESLKDENVKELSIEEDILGTQSLLMSESDEDAVEDNTSKITQSPLKKISHKISKRIIDSDDDDNDGGKDEVSPANQEDTSIMNKKKISALIDSDSDDYTQGSKGSDQLGTHNDLTIFELGKNPKSKSKNKHNKNEKIKNKELDTSDTDDSIEIKKTKKNLSLIDSESSDESGTEINANNLESSDREANFEKNDENNSKEKNKKIKVVRASAKKAMDEMQAIQSEQQRLHREAHISIPYHKPRKHTLDEFLMRRMIIQPQKCSPVAETIQKRSLKMTIEELEEYAKLMEERAKEATEFFKSESENEEDKVLKINEGVLDKPLETTKENFVDISKHEIADEQNNVTYDLPKTQDGVQLTQNELEAILAEEQQIPQPEVEEERPTCSKVLITEVIELPKLDMNTVKISPIQKYTSRSSLNVKQLLANKKLSESPSLSGNSSKLIDLETGDLIDKKPAAIDNLMKRLMSTMKVRKAKNSESCTILSVENGKLEMSKVNINTTEVNNFQKEAKPGAAYFELKKNLKEIIKKKRVEEMNKKQEEELEYNKCLEVDDENCDDIDEDENEGIYDEECEPDDKIKCNDIMVDEEENTISLKNDGVEISDDEEDAEYETDDYDEYDNNKIKKDGVDKDDEDEEENENYNNDLHLDKSQRKNRIIKACDDTDEEEGENDDIDFLKTQPATTQPFILETQASGKTSLEGDERELMALCSGTFDETQKTFVSALMSQIPITQNCGKQVNDEELLQLCSGTFDQPSVSLQSSRFDQISAKLKTKCNNILSSDEESDKNELMNDNEIIKQRVKKLTKRLKKRKVKLGFSDDEEEDEPDNEDDKQVEQEEVDDNLEINIEEPDTFIDYDSEENEIVVKMTKDDKVIRAQNFVENEAELSESDWGSADEDENNLDKYDIELGDEDEFDKEKLRTELGQIHARKMLDEDIREVRKIQEMLFEDEEKDGVGRQRTFKWKNAENGFSLDDGQPLDETGDGQNGDSGDELNEHQWRKVRYEREQFLKEQGLKRDSQDMSTVVTNSTSTIALTAKKLQIVKAKKNTLSSTNTKKGSPFLISRGIAAMHKKSVRGSFLVRDKETLNKLAGLAKVSLSSVAVTDMGDTTSTVSIKSSKPTNFVFATLTEEEHESIKRKADDFLNSSNENGKNFIKKPKIEPRRDKCFIDQLL